jgi:hypothetical protein
VPENIVRRRQIAIGKIHTRRAYVLGRGTGDREAAPLAAISSEIRSMTLVMPIYFMEKAVMWLKRLLEYEVLAAWFRTSEPVGAVSENRSGRRRGKYFDNARGL